MSNLEDIVLVKIASDKRENNARVSKARYALNIYTDKCEEIVNTLGFLTKYGFSFEIDTYRQTDCGKYQGFFIKRVIMKHYGRHFAILYPCPESDEWDFSSCQIEMSLRKHYTYESGVKAIVSRLRFR